MNSETEQKTCLSEATAPVVSITSAGNPAHQLVPVSQTVTVISAASTDLAPPPPMNLSCQRRPRLGKIARLPKLHRDMVNRMLRNNCTYRNIVDALYEVGVSVTERNVSNWKTRGGYQQWCLDEDRAAEMRLVQDRLLQYHRKDDATHVSEVALQAAATNMAGFLLSPEGFQQLQSDPDKYARVVSTACRVSAELQGLQKYRDESSKALGSEHNPERIRRENEQEIEQVREGYTSTPASSARAEAAPHRNFLPATSISERPVPRPMSEEEKKQVDRRHRQAMADVMSQLKAKSN